MTRQQAEITIYLTRFCPYCVRAKSLLKSKQAIFEEIDVSIQAEKRYEMIEKSNGATSVPQIFIGGQHIGGCDDMFALEADNQLDRLLFPE